MIRLLFSVAALALLALGSSTATAQDTIDVGLLKNEDIVVVQKMLYPKAGRNEYGAHMGWMPFDAYTLTPLMSITTTFHLDETMAGEVALGAGYSFKNATMKELEGPAYGITPDAYSYLGSIVADVQWSPIYAKMNWKGTRIFHHDVYFLGGAGLTIERALMPDKSMAFAPTVATGVGARLFLSNGNAIRVQLRDDFLLEKRVKTEDTQGTFIKQNVALTIGYVMMGGLD